MIYDELPYSKMEYCIEAQGYPELEIDITENGEYDVKKFAKANVNVSGGGSSDFSTAQVTIANNIDNNVSLYMPVIYETTPMPSIDKAIYCAYSLAEGAPSETVRVALYGGTCLVQPASDIMGKTFTATGNAEYSNGMIIITGDCSITIS